MRKPFGVILLMIGLFAIIKSVEDLNRLSDRDNSFLGKVGLALNGSNRNIDDQQKREAVFMLAFGAVSFIGGLIMVLTKSPKRKEHKAAEIMAKARVANVTEKTSQFNEEILTHLEKLAKLKEQGIITEEEFAIQKKKILG